ncbi:MAG TPA: PaaI family thioesterase [Acidimicrobiales bacterium]|nr:PaaI family thioesterase [Acidimicrobiales bacterium]
MASELTTFMHETMPFSALIGAEAIAAAGDEVRARVGWEPSRCTAGGVMHGGLLMTLADTVGAWCAFLNLPEGAGTTTLESKTNFLRAVRDGFVEATARPLHVGRTVVVVDTELRDDDDRLVARVTQTQAVLSPQP